MEEVEEVNVIVAILPPLRGHRLRSIRTSLITIRYSTGLSSPVSLYSDKIFGIDVKVLTPSLVTSIDRYYLSCFQDCMHIATDGSVINEKAGVGIYVRELG